MKKERKRSSKEKSNAGALHKLHYKKFFYQPPFVRPYVEGI
jgi:hypothetical protein